MKTTMTEADLVDLQAIIARLPLLKKGDKFIFQITVYKWFAERFDTADLQDAKVLLDEFDG